MARRQLILTMTLSLDDDLATVAQQFRADGTSDYSDALNELRTRIFDETSLMLGRFDAEIDDPEFARIGVTGIDEP